MPAAALAGPALVQVGDLELRWSGVLLAAGLVVGYLAVRAAAARRGLSPRATHDVALWSLPEALLAARVAYVLAHPEVYLPAPSRVVQLWDGGVSVGVGLLVGLWAAHRYARGHGLPSGSLLDAAVPGLLIAQALAAIGRGLDLLTEPVAPLPPWDLALANASAVPSRWTDPLLVSPFANAMLAVGLLVVYAVLARRVHAPGLLFRLYLLGQALGQIAIRLLTGGVDPDIVGIVAWAAVAVAAALSALYHPRSAEC